MTRLSSYLLPSANAFTVSVLTVPETLHLIPEKEMMAIDTQSFPDYEYCPISESRTRPKNAKIQFVALVASKPTIGAGKKLHWTVADRTGVVCTTPNQILVPKWL